MRRCTRLGGFNQHESSLMLSILLATVWGAVTVKNPYVIAVVLGLTILLITTFLGGKAKFLGFIIFLVLVGGLIILIRYCVILTPYKKTSMSWTSLFGFLFYYGGDIERPYAYGLLYRANIIVLMCIILFLVILAIVSIIDYSRGTIKYDKHFLLRCVRLYRLRVAFCVGYSLHDTKRKIQALWMWVWHQRRYPSEVLHKILPCRGYFPNFRCRGVPHSPDTLYAIDYITFPVHPYSGFIVWMILRRSRLTLCERA